jgi:hypothetical protein
MLTSPLAQAASHEASTSRCARGAPAVAGTHPRRRGWVQPAANRHRCSADGGPPWIQSPHIGAPPPTGEPPGFLAPSTLCPAGFRRRRDEAAGHEMGRDVAMVGGGVDIFGYGEIQIYLNIFV